PLNLMWLEEPIPAENVEAYKLISAETSTPICAGENLYLAHGFRKILEMGAVDIIMPDLQKTGGLGEGQRIANLAHLYYVPFAPHMVASFLGAMASCRVWRRGSSRCRRSRASAWRSTKRACGAMRRRTCRSSRRNAQLASEAVIA